MVARRVVGRYQLKYFSTLQLYVQGARPAHDTDFVIELEVRPIVLRYIDEIRGIFIAKAYNVEDVARAVLLISR